MAVNTSALFIATSLIDGLAITLTIFRLFVRFRIRRIWWEDMWAALMLVCGTTFVIAQLFRFEIDDYDTAHTMRWITLLAFTSTLWAARMSLLYSTIRVISPSSALRKLTRVMTLFFLLFWATIMVLKIRWCVYNTEPIFSLGSMRPMCNLPALIIFFEPITSCISDTALVNLSLKLLWKVKLPRRQRRMILSLFSSSAILSVCSLFHATCQLVTPFQIGMYVAFETELASALIVCNLLVIVTYMYRVILSSPNGSLPSDSEEDDDFTTPIHSITSVGLTTVDLDASICTTSEVADVELSNDILSSSRHSLAA